MTGGCDLLPLSPSVRLRVQVAMEGRCEGCHVRGDPQRLRVCKIGAPRADPLLSILVLCPSCSAYARHADRKILKGWAQRRPFRQRALLRKILGYRRSPYIPPEGPDAEELYRIACTGWCLNGSG